MINLEQRIESISKLINWLDGYLSLPSDTVLNDYAALNSVVKNGHIYNPWCIEPFNKNALADLSHWLRCNLLDSSGLLGTINNSQNKKQIALLPSSNIPLSGIYELITMYLAGQCIVLRHTAHKHDLLQLISKKLVAFCEASDCSILWTDTYPKDLDGWVMFDKPEQNTLHKYFDKRKSLFIPDEKQFVVLNNSTTRQELEEIAGRIFVYWGFNACNIRKVFVPLGYDFHSFFEALEKHSFVFRYNCYANNYDYHKSVFLMNRIPFLDNGFIILREESSMNVPIGCLHYTYYSNQHEYEELVRLSHESMQRCEERNVELVLGFVNSF
jgi:hypothetical protein